MSSSSDRIPHSPAMNVEPRPEVDYPLSPNQRAGWFRQQLEPEDVSQQIAQIRCVHGALEPDRLQQALWQLVARQPMLRTTFPSLAGEPVQRVAVQGTIELYVYDAQHWSDTRLQQQFSTEAHRPFDIECGPLMRAVFLRRADQEQILMLVLHQLIADHWSVTVLMQELLVLSMKEQVGGETPLPHLELDYPSYIDHQRSLLAGPAGEHLKFFWQQQLAGELPVLTLPTDAPRPIFPTYRGAAERVLLDQSLLDDLHAVATRYGTTLPTLLLASFYVLLARESGQTDLIIGVPLAGRQPAYLARMVGPLANLLPLRMHLSSDQPFDSVLRQISQTLQSAANHQVYPLAQLIEQFTTDQELSITPLFQSMFLLDGMPPLDSQPDITARSATSALSATDILSLVERTAQYDLSLIITPDPDGLTATLEYAADLFAPATITRIIGHYRMLLSSISAQPTYALGTLSMLTASEQDQIIRIWNAERIDYLPAESIHHVFEMQAARTPDAPAVIFKDTALTYRQLNQRANQLAHYLRRLGVGPDVYVGICLERSLEMVIGILGILKAGGAYVPLDPTYPAERLAFIVDDAQVVVLLTQDHLRTRLPASRARTLALDIDWPVIGQEADVDCLSDVIGANVAYIIYTSGSTGTPKGVAVPQQAVIDHSYVLAQRCQLQPDDRLLQFVSLNSDIAAEDLFPIWLCGATVVLWPGEPGAGAFADFLGFVDQMQVTILNLPTAYWHELVTYLDRAGEHVPSSVRLVIVGGEKALTERLSTWQQLVGDRVHWNNAYGPTETTISTTIYAPPPDWTSQSLTSIPIGRPVANTEVYLLNDQLQLVPVGVPGELHIGGVRLARGYLNHPARTAEKFMPHPFSTAPGGRLYKTGDLARYLPDGNIEFLGRVDQQVKIRGFRIELGDVETALLAHPAIRDAVVIAREDTPGSRRLVAYLVSDQASPPSSGVLQEFLRATQPTYMIPVAFVFLSALPLTPNGKIDRRALPIPETIRHDARFDTPRTHTEEVLAKIWAQALQVEQVGIHENFFELGGQSLISLQIVARANEAGLQIDPRQLLPNPTIAELAAAVRDTDIHPVAPGRADEHGLVAQEFGADLLDMSAALQSEPNAFDDLEEIVAPPEFHSPSSSDSAGPGRSEER